MMRDITEDDVVAAQQTLELVREMREESDDDRTLNDEALGLLEMQLDGLTQALSVVVASDQ